MRQYGKALMSTSSRIMFPGSESCFSHLLLTWPLTSYSNSASVFVNWQDYRHLFHRLLVWKCIRSIYWRPMYLWLCWVFMSVWGLSLVVASGGHSSSRCAGLSLSRPLLLRSTGSRRTGSVVVAHGPSCSAACEIFPDQGSNPCALHWQVDSQPLRHQGSPCFFFLQPEDLWLEHNTAETETKWLLS